jgi:hypothetical protein
MRPDKKQQQRKRSKDEHAAIVHAAIVEAVRSVVVEWDPYALLAQGAPPDEFNNEIHAVARRIERIGSPNDAIQVLSQIFSAYFQPEYFRPEDCQEAGEQLYRVLQARGLVTGRE